MKFVKIIDYCFIFVFFINPVLSQKIEKGTYKSLPFYEIDPITHDKIYYNYPEYYESIYIVDDSLFEYKYWCDIGSDLGYGYYRLNNNNLVLNFTDPLSKFDTTSFKILNSETDKGDSAEYKFVIADVIDRTPLRAIITYKNCEKSLLDSCIFSKSGCETDEDGIANFKIAKKNFPCEVIVISAGFKPFRFLLNDSLNKTVEVLLKGYSHFVPVGKVIRYVIKDINKKGFYLLGGVWNEWTFFKKMD